MGESNTVNAFERKFFELLLRHELPAECEIQVEVKTKDSKTPGRTVFSVSGDAIGVKSNLCNLNLHRLVDHCPCW